MSLSCSSLSVHRPVLPRPCTIRPPRARPDRADRSARIVVTASQRARLVLSLGVLNIVLATIALSVGGVELQQRASASGGPSQVAIVPTPAPTSGAQATSSATAVPTA